MLALTGCIGKTYQLLLAARLTTYLTTNNLIDNTMQKAFLPGINGCIEHNIVMDEIIADAKAKHHTAHITFFDLEDAFGSVPHSLIDETFRRNHLPNNIIDYFNNLYKNSKSVVSTSKFKTKPFCFRRGVFQGDPLSPIVFLLVFNPVLQSLKQEEEKYGYNLEDKRFITLPYADDFCIITTHKRSHQKIINTINNHVISMGMKLKPSKCRSFSISSGRPTSVSFSIGESMIPSIRDEDQKFLGKLLFFTGKSSDTFDYVKNVFKEALENIDKCAVRNEYKLWIYSNYLQPSKRFLLTIHNLNQTNLKNLDTFTDKFIKKWVGLPSCATNAIIHLQAGMNIKSILYMEAHCLSHTRTRLVIQCRGKFHVLILKMEYNRKKSLF